MDDDGLPKPLARLEELFGKPSQSVTGAAVFTSDTPLTTDQLEEFAKSKYRYFVGHAWEEFGEENWTKTWAESYLRPSGKHPGILQEMAQLKEHPIALAASQVTENHDDPKGASEALSDVFDAASICEVRLYNIGDTEAITGVLIAALSSSGRGIALVFLMD